MGLKLITKKQDAESRLAELGIRMEAVQQSLLQGVQVRQNCGPNDAVLVPGLLQWNGTQSGLREFMAPDGWRKLVDHGHDLVVNAHGTIAIAVSSGNKYTGEDGIIDPTTKSPKGPRTIHAVATNNKLMNNLFPELVPEPAVLLSKGRLTYVLLFIQVGQIIRSELSLPATISGKRIDSWSERIILPVMDLSASTLPPHSPESGGGPAVNVEVRRKQR